MRWVRRESTSEAEYQLACTGGPEADCHKTVTHVLEHEGRTLYGGNAVCDEHATEAELKLLREEYGVEQ